MLTIRRVINTLGINIKYRGYRYLVRAIELATEDENRLLSVDKRIYSVIAQEYDVSSSCVQRNLRTAINACWKNGNRPFLNTISGYSLLYTPTVADFISMIASYINDMELRAVLLQHDLEVTEYALPLYDQSEVEP